MNTITMTELETESVELLPERAALCHWGHFSTISATNFAVAINNGYGVANANAQQWIVG